MNRNIADLNEIICTLKETLLDWSKNRSVDFLFPQSPDLPECVYVNQELFCRLFFDLIHIVYLEGNAREICIRIRKIENRLDFEVTGDFDLASVRDEVEKREPLKNSIKESSSSIFYSSDEYGKKIVLTLFQNSKYSYKKDTVLLFDEESFLKRYSYEFCTAIIDLFLSEYKECLDNLKHSIETGEMKKIIFYAHRMKNKFLYIQSPKNSSLCQEIEDNASSLSTPEQLQLFSNVYENTLALIRLLPNVKLFAVEGYIAKKMNENVIKPQIQKYAN